MCKKEKEEGYHKRIKHSKMTPYKRGSKKDFFKNDDMV